ncbi:MAG: arginine--tRNA ligase [bacterium]|nr:arginine--tRNA ligase [bacterium]MDN5835265.1 arginine--tRNA ligase [bacterium]
MYSKLLSQIIKDQYDLDLVVPLSRPDAEFGDYATNIALQLAGRLKLPPRDIASTIADKLRAEALVGDVSVAGPGFINLTLSDAALLEETDQPVQPSRLDKTVVAETNNPNPFKAMHIGHAYNSIVADTIARLVEIDGAKVYRVSYHGDIGLHVGKSMYSLLKYADGDFDKIAAIPTEKQNSFMSRMYAEGSSAYKTDESSKNEITELAEQSFEPKSALYTRIYELCKTWSFNAIDETVARLGNLPTVYRFLESETDARGVDVVKRNTPAVFQNSDGAWIFKGSQHGAFDNAFVSSKGRGLYAARDLGLMLLKNEQFHPDESYIITAEEQRDYFKGVIAAAGMIWPDQKGKTTNISTGTVKLSTGKMSSREGDVVEIAWLFDQFAAAIKARGGQPDTAIVAGAMRYQFLKVKIGSDVVFDIDEAVSLNGNTGSYLQYAHARASSILNKSTQEIAATTEPKFNKSERSLVRKISQYNDALAVSINDLSPHHMCTYLYELAQEFNRFYEKNQVIGDDQEAARLYIVKLYADTLQKGLSVLGIEPPGSM